MAAMTAPTLSTYTAANGVTCVGVEGASRGVSFAFTARAGGVSSGAYASLNVGGAVGDDEAAVETNRLRALAAIGVPKPVATASTVVPRQVHGSDVVCVTASDAVAVARARTTASAGADAVVVSTSGVAVLMAFADCVPIVLVAPGAFAVVHSGWRGTMAKVVVRALGELVQAAGCAAGDVWAYVGPHIAAPSYEVSPELAARFADAFGRQVIWGERNVDLGRAVASSLVGAGVAFENVVDCGIDTAASTNLWYSHRASGGLTGRHAAVAWVA